MARRPEQFVDAGIEELFGAMFDEPVVPKPEAAVVPNRAEPFVDVPARTTDTSTGPRLGLLDCGHCDFGSDAEHEAARAEGRCCGGADKGRMIHWWALAGRFVRPVPPRERRSKAREGAGYPGLCCDDAGLYVGGVGNDCRYYRPAGSNLCTYHRPTAPATAEPAETGTGRGKRKQGATSGD